MHSFFELIYTRFIAEPELSEKSSLAEVASALGAYIIYAWWIGLYILYNVMQEVFHTSCVEYDARNPWGK